MKYYLLLLSLGCAVGEPIDSPYFMSTVSDGPSTEEESYDNYFDPCEMAFAPDPNSSAYVQSAVERWSEATGCDIYVAMWGLPVETVAQIYTEDGRRVGGEAFYGPDGLGTLIHISEGTRNPYTVTAHEVGHILSYPLEGRKAHTGTGLMQPKTTIDNLIDEASLELICGGLNCRKFNPERWGEFEWPEIELPD